jgi:hypothetical protein
MKKFSNKNSILILGISLILVGSSWAISTSMSSANCQADKSCGVAADPNLFRANAGKLIELGFGNSFVNEDWSKLGLDAKSFFLVQDKGVFEVHHPIDSPFSFYEITNPRYLDEQGLTSSGPCLAVAYKGDLNFLVLGSDDNLYPFSPYSLCDNGNLRQYLSDLQNGLKELGYNQTPII